MSEQLQEHLESIPPLTQAEFDSWSAPKSEDMLLPAYNIDTFEPLTKTSPAENTELEGPREVQRFRRLKKFGSAMLTASAYTVQALYVGKEQVKSYALGASASATSLTSKYAEILSPKMEGLAYRRGGENKWRRASRSALKGASVGLAYAAPKAKEISHKALGKYEQAYNNTEYNKGGGRIVRAARKRTEGNPHGSYKLTHDGAEEQMRSKRQEVEMRVGSAKPRLVN